MADFLAAYKRTENFEGDNIYTKTPGDSGGETWSGISRVFNPKWLGWKILDTILNKKNNQVINNPELEELKLDFYRSNYWNPIWGDKISKQEVANDLYDTAVNMGVGTSIKLSERQFKLKETAIMSNTLLDKLNLVI